MTIQTTTSTLVHNFLLHKHLNMFTICNKTVNHNTTKYLNKDLITLICLPECIEISACSFQDFSNLQAIYAPNVERIEYGAFQGCPRLSTIWAPKCQTERAIVCSIDCPLVRCIEYTDKFEVHDQMPSRMISRDDVNNTIHIEFGDECTQFALDCAYMCSVEGLINAVQHHHLYIKNNADQPISINGAIAEILTTEGYVDEMYQCEVETVIRTGKDKHQTAINNSFINRLITPETYINTKNCRDVKYLDAPECTRLTINASRPSKLTRINCKALREVCVDMEDNRVEWALSSIVPFDCERVEKVVFKYDTRHDEHIEKTIQLKRSNPYLFRLLRNGLIYNEFATHEEKINGKIHVMANSTLIPEKHLDTITLPKTGITITSENVYALAIEAVQHDDEEKWIAVLEEANKMEIWKFVGLAVIMGMRL